MKISRARVLCAALSTLATTAAPFAADAASVSLSNFTGKTIAYVYAAPAGSGVFTPQDELLGGGSIAPGESMKLPAGAGETCRFDLRAVFTDETAIEHDDVNLCEDAMWSIGSWAQREGIPG